MNFNGIGGGGGGPTDCVVGCVVTGRDGAGGAGGGGFGLNLNGSRLLSTGSGRGALNACRSSSVSAFACCFAASAPRECSAASAAGDTERTRYTATAMMTAANAASTISRRLRPMIRSVESRQQERELQRRGGLAALVQRHAVDHDEIGSR